MIPGISSQDTLLKTAGGHFLQINNSHQHPSLTRVIHWHKTGLREVRRLGSLMRSFVWICCSGTSISSVFRVNADIAIGGVNDIVDAG
jgi:hypothetical protein